MSRHFLHEGKNFFKKIADNHGVENQGDIRRPDRFVSQASWVRDQSQSLAVAVLSTGHGTFKLGAACCAAVLAEWACRDSMNRRVAQLEGTYTQ
jgi:hypothetical protein